MSFSIVKELGSSGGYNSGQPCIKSTFISDAYKNRVQISILRFGKYDTFFAFHDAVSPVINKCHTLYCK